VADSGDVTDGAKKAVFEDAFADVIEDAFGDDWSTDGVEFSEDTDAAKNAVSVDGVVFENDDTDNDFVDSLVELFPCNPVF
jgi:hypothetical protein